MAYNVKAMLESMYTTESAVNNNIEDVQAESRLTDIIAELDSTYVRLPYSIDSLHILHIGETYNIPYRDLARFCRNSSYKTITEAIPVIADTFNLKKDSIRVMIETSNSCNCNAKLTTTVNRLTDALDHNISVFQYGNEIDDDDVIDYQLIFGEDADILSDNEEDDTTIDTAFSDEDLFDVDESCVAICDETYDYNVSMVNVYNKDFDYFIEFADLEKYMDDLKLDSVKEAVWNIANYNDVDPKRISLLVESKKSIVDKKSSKGKLKNKQANKRKLAKIKKSSNKSKVKFAVALPFGNPAFFKSPSRLKKG